MFKAMCFALLISRAVLAEQETTWFDFEPQPEPWFTLGKPKSSNPHLFDQRGDGTLSERSPDCRLEELTGCCDELWGAQWWDYQQKMDDGRDHFIDLYKARHENEEPYHDPVIRRMEDFHAPMEAAATLAFPQIFSNDKSVARPPRLTFRCVLTLRPDSLLGFVAALNYPKSSPKGARFTKLYKLTCLKKSEYPFIKEQRSKRYVDPVTHVVPGTMIKIMNPMTRSGFCGPRSLLEKSSRRQGNNNELQPQRRPTVEENTPFLYDPSVIPAAEGQSAVESAHATLPSMQISAGATGCIGVPYNLMMTGATLSMTATPFVDTWASPIANADITDVDSYFQDADIEQWDVLQDFTAQSCQPTQFTLSSSSSTSSQMRTQLSDEPHKQMRHASLRASLEPATKRRKSDITEGLIANEKQRLEAKDIDWDAVLGRATGASTSTSVGSKVSACVNVPMSEPYSSYALQFEPWEINQSTDDNIDIGLISIDWP